MSEEIFALKLPSSFNENMLGQTLSWITGLVKSVWRLTNIRLFESQSLYPMWVRGLSQHDVLWVHEYVWGGHPADERLAGL